MILLHDQVAKFIRLLCHFLLFQAVLVEFSGLSCSIAWVLTEGFVEIGRNS